MPGTKYLGICYLLFFIITAKYNMEFDSLFPFENMVKLFASVCTSYVYLRKHCSINISKIHTNLHKKTHLYVLDFFHRVISSE